jgi:hypothetical protein
LPNDSARSTERENVNITLKESSRRYKGPLMLLGVVGLLALLAPAQAQLQRPILPMGSLIQCTTGEKISSVRDDIGDPILCRVTRLVVFGQQVLPYGSYLGGTFDEAKDPGHLVKATALRSCSRMGMWCIISLPPSPVSPSRRAPHGCPAP